MRAARSDDRGGNQGPFVSCCRINISPSKTNNEDREWAERLFAPFSNLQCLEPAEVCFVSSSLKPKITLHRTDWLSNKYDNIPMSCLPGRYSRRFVVVRYSIGKGSTAWYRILRHPYMSRHSYECCKILIWNVHSQPFGDWTTEVERASLDQKQH